MNDYKKDINILGIDVQIELSNFDDKIFLTGKYKYAEKDHTFRMEYLQGKINEVNIDTEEKRLYDYLEIMIKDSLGLLRKPQGI